MPFKISEFTADINKRGVLHSHSFEAKFRKPDCLSASNSTPENLSIRCESASIPGVTLATAEGPPRLGVGPNEAQPYGVTFDDITLGFVVDRKSEIYKYFYQWMNYIVGYSSIGNAESNYEVGYRKKFMTEIEVTLFDASQKQIQKVTMRRAYPKSIAAVDLNWDSQGTLVKLSIPFSYKFYDIEFFEPNNDNPRGGERGPTGSPPPSVTPGRATTISRNAASQFIDPQTVINNQLTQSGIIEA